MKNILNLIWLVQKGGIGSGNWGHAGRNKERGGSQPRNMAMSLTTGRDAERRQKAVKGDMFFKGNIKTASMSELYNGSSQQVKDLADETGIVATDEASYQYVQSRADKFVKPNESQKLVNDWLESGIPNKEFFDNQFKKMSDWPMLQQVAGMNVYPSVARHRLSSNTYELNSFIQAYGVDYAGGKYSSQNRSEFGRILDIKEGDLFNKYVGTLTPSKHEPGKETQKFLDDLSDDDVKVLTGLYSEKVLKEELSRKFDDLATWKQKYESEEEPYSSNYDNRAVIRTKTMNFLENISKEDLDAVKGSLSDTDKFIEVTSEIYKKHDLAPSTKKVEDFKGFGQVNKYSNDEMIGLSDVSDTERLQETTRIKRTWDDAEHSRFRSQVNNVFRVKASDSVRADFDKLANERGNVSTNQYHGTDAFAAQKIASKGYIIRKDPKAGRMFGDGIYTTDCASKAIQYIGTSFGRGNQNGVMFVNQTVFGKQSNARLKKTWSQSNFHSIYAQKGIRTQNNNGDFSTLRNDEYIIKDPSAVLPMYWIDLDRINR